VRWGNSSVVTISNPQAYNVNVTYNINGGTNVIGLVGANASVNITISTATTGNFVYNLVNVSNPVLQIAQQT
jgi:P pilus assembly chaperone PapD